MKCPRKIVGIDLFAGAGGMSLGAQMAGIAVTLAVEKDVHAAATYAKNHPKTKLIIDGIETLKRANLPVSDATTVLFGGPPCQGFSTSNQKTRSLDNPSNWLFKEFVRVARLKKPDWVVLENVPGILETSNGIFRETILQAFQKIGYTCTHGVLCAKDFGVPQVRSRFFLVGSLHGKSIRMPKARNRAPVTVSDAISDLPAIDNGANQDYLLYPRCVPSNYAKAMRNGANGCTGHLVTKNSDLVIKRFRHVKQGNNWEDIPARLMCNYSDRTRCHTNIYRRLRADMPSTVLGNYRKSMYIHPWCNRGLSVREAARLQSFPDWYVFCGSIGFQQQQVGNAVPPLLAKAVFKEILKHL